MQKKKDRMLHRCCLFRKSNLFFLLHFCWLCANFLKHCHHTLLHHQFSLSCHSTFFSCHQTYQQCFVMGKANQFVCCHSSYLFILLMSGPLGKRKFSPRAESHFIGTLL
uniref:Secreted protein n=1 Tax=Rhipicephalus appendiculatus TaxID=34631 RepID=A0A131YE01_RHIAP